MYDNVCFNRTFMELKLYSSICFFALSAVLIVPLWNWNLNAVSSLLVDSARFNRTFMELKYQEQS